MKKFKILLSVVLVILLLATTTTVSSFAANEPVEIALSIDYCNLSFSDSIYIKYAVKAENVSNKDAVKLLIWNEEDYLEGKPATATLQSAYTQDINGTEYLIYNYKDLAAKQMTDVVYARAYVNESGTETYSEVIKYSILQYAYSKLGKTAEGSTNESFKTFLSDMLQYGTSAQKYFNYNVDRLSTMDFYQVSLTNGTLSDGCSHGLYLEGEKVSISAPETDAAGIPFSHWENENGEQVADTAAYEVTVGTQNETYTAVYGNSEPSLIISSASAHVGDDTVSVAISVKNNPGVLGASFSLSYDSALTLSSVSKGTAWSSLFYTRPGTYSNPCTFGWDGVEADAGDGELLILTFDISGITEPGTYEISISYNYGDIFDNDIAPIDFKVRSGSIVIN